MKRLSHLPRRTKFAAVTVALLTLLIVWAKLAGPDGPSPDEVSLSRLEELIADAEVGDLVIDTAELSDAENLLELTLADGETFQVRYPQGAGEKLADRLVAADVDVSAKKYDGPGLAQTLLVSLVPFFMFAGLIVWAVRAQRGAVSKYSKGRGGVAKVPATRFHDVAGVDEAVEELAEVVDYLRDPGKYKKLGVSPARGILLTGPPGTGKTLLAKAVAGEAGVPFYAISGSDFVETYVGVGAARVRALFDAARKHGRAVVFIDEIDAVGRARQNGPGVGGHEERDSTLNQLLTELDGFASREGLFLLGATNRDDMLDAALTRPGRFDRKIVVAAPDRGGRAKILALHLKGRRVADDVDVDALARRTPGLAGAELEGLVMEAARVAARAGRPEIRHADLNSALSTHVMGRERRSAIISERDRLITAHHESGHAVAALLSDHAPDPVSVSIIPRGHAGGVTWMGGSDHDYLTRSQADDQLVVLLAGRAAEERLLHGDFTQGAADDLARATELALSMAVSWGMGGHLVTIRDADPRTLLTGPAAAELRAAVEAKLQQAMLRAQHLIDTHAAGLDALVDALLEDETVDGDRIGHIVRAGQVPGGHGADRSAA